MTKISFGEERWSSDGMDEDDGSPSGMDNFYLLDVEDE